MADPHQERRPRRPNWPTWSRIPQHISPAVGKLLWALIAVGATALAGFWQPLADYLRRIIVTGESAVFLALVEAKAPLYFSIAVVVPICFDVLKEEARTRLLFRWEWKFWLVWGAILTTVAIMLTQVSLEGLNQAAREEALERFATWQKCVLGAALAYCLWAKLALYFAMQRPCCKAQA